MDGASASPPDHPDLSHPCPSVPAMPRLSDDLRALPDDALAALFARRADLRRDPPADMAGLAQRLSTPSGARAGVDLLDRPALQVCQHLLVVAGHPLGDGRVRLGDLADWLALAPGEPEGEALLAAVDGLVQQLREAGLVHGDPARPVAGLRQTLAPPVAAGRTAARLLDLVPDDVVRLVAGCHGVDATDLPCARGRLAELLPRLGSALLDGLPDEAVDVFLAAVETQQYTVALPGGPVGSWAERARHDPLLALVVAGALLPLTTTVGEFPRELRQGVLREPDAHRVRVRLPSRRPPPGDAVREAAHADAASRAARLVGLVELLLETWSREPAVQLASGGLGVKEMRRAGKLLDVDERDAGRVIEIALVASLVRGEDRGSAVLPSPVYDDWLSLDLPHRWAALAGAWWRSDRLPSAAGSREGGGPPVPALHWQSPPGAREARRRVLRLLAEEPGLSADEVLDRLAADAPARWVGDATPELVTAGAAAEALLLGIVSGPPAPGVLAPWAPDGAEEWPGEDAVAALARTQPARVSRVTLQNDLTAIAAGPVSAEVVRVLDLLADVESRGAATTWRFGPASVRRAFDDGWSATMVLHELEQVADRGVPGTLATLVEDAARRHGRVRVGAAAAYLRCADEAVLVELVRARRAASLKLRVVAPLVAVTTVKPAKVVEVLRAAGYSPAADEGGGVTVGRAAPRRGTRQLVASLRLGYERPEPPALEPAIWVRRLRLADEPEVRRRRQVVERLGAAAARGSAVRLTYVVGGQQRQHRVMPLAVEDDGVRVRRVGRDGPGETIELMPVDVLDVSEVT